MTSLLSTLRVVLDLGRALRAALPDRPSSRRDGPALPDLVDRAAAERAAGRPDEARKLFEQALRSEPAGGEPLAIIHYELGRLDAERGRAAGAAAHFRSALRADRGFVPAAIALGDAQEAAGDVREAARTWERSAEVAPALAILGRLERVHRRDGRPSRMIALYRAASERAPDNLALALALGRVYFELEMLDEAADQFEKIEVRAPDMPIVHAFLAAVFERRGETREAFEEYRRALRLARAFDWPHACSACGAAGAAWADRCDRCRRWNTLRPVDPRGAG
jgi:tetratricopeptide (TPR) repeat protein